MPETQTEGNCPDNSETGAVNAAEPVETEIPEATAAAESVETEIPEATAAEEPAAEEAVQAPAEEPVSEEPANTSAVEPAPEQAANAPAATPAAEQTTQAPAREAVNESELMEQTNRNYAGFFPRMVAFCVDSLLAALVGLLFRLMPLIISATGLIDPAQHLLFTFSLYDIVAYVGATLYFVLLTYFTGATLGKRLMNIKVITLSKKGKFLDILFRETIGRYLSSILCIGYIVGGFDIERRCFHDSLSDTRVVYNIKT